METNTVMISLLEFLRLVLPDAGMKSCVSMKNGKVRQQRFTESFDDLATILQATNARGEDAYFGCATFDKAKVIAAQQYNASLTREEYKTKKKKERSRDNALLCKCFWLDIDCGEGKPYANAEDGIQAVDEFANRLGLPLPFCVHSGRGIHAYFILSEAIPAAQWRETARLFKRATEILGLHADPSRTADVASILRPPGTINYKNGATVTVEEGEPVEPISFADFTARIGQYTGITPAHPPAVSPATSSRLNASANVLGGLKGPPSMTQGYPDGQRTAALAHRAGHLLGTGHPYDDTLAQCLAWNQLNNPPLPERKNYPRRYQLRTARGGKTCRSLAGAFAINDKIIIRTLSFGSTAG